MSDPKIMHIVNALGKTHNYTISLLIVSYLLSVLWKITISTEFHEEVNAGLISKTCVDLGQIRVTEEAMGLYP